MSLRARIVELVEQDRRDELAEIVADEPRAVRHLVSFTYRPETAVRATACYGMGVAARHHPEFTQQVLRRLVWAMNDESGTNALTAPEVVKAVADVRPELLVPLVPDLMRLAADEGLQEGLAAALRRIIEQCPGTVGRGIEDSLNKKFAKVAKRRKKYGNRRRG